MRFLSLLASFILILPLATLAEEDAPKKKGGFTGATPRPAVKKASAEATPAPKKKTRVADDDAALATKKAASDDDAPAPKTKPFTKKSVTEDEDTTPKKKTQSEEGEATTKKAATDDDATPKKKAHSTEAVVEKKITEDEATVKTKSTDAEGAPKPTAKVEHAPAATIAPEELAEFASQPPRIQTLITAALELTKLNLTYTYGSSDPTQGGMDCSGTISYLLHEQGFKEVPRDSSSQYVWARKGGPFYAVVSKSADSFEFKDLKPGDLMFWTGTYETGREIPISHVMLYLGTEKKTKKRVMFGSSDGRSYNGVSRWGVSVFDFKMPKADPNNPEKAKVDFVGYGRIPGLSDAAEPQTLAAAAPPEKKDEAKPSEDEDKPVATGKKSSSKTGSSGTSKSRSTKSKASQ